MTYVPFQPRPLSAFGDLRTIELSPVYQVSFEYTVSNTDVGLIETAGSGSVTQADAMCVVRSGTTTGSSAEWEIAHNAKYRAGLGGLARFTAMFTTGVAGTEQIVGLADASGSSESHLNGYAVGFDGDTFGFLRWQNDTLTTIAQADWDDPMDGTGASGMTIDPTKLNMYEIRFQYLGAGSIQLWIEDDSTGRFVLVHDILYANLNTTPSVYNPNFHLMSHVLNGATTADLTIKSGSMAYFIEGRTRYTELQQHHYATGEKSKATVTTEVAIVTIRNKANYASKVNYLDVILAAVGGSIEASSANNLGSLRLVKNATLGGTPSWSDIHTTNSIIEVDTSGTTVTGGTELGTVPLAGKNDKILNGNVSDHNMLLSPGDTLTVAGISSNSATMKASLLWKELI